MRLLSVEVVLASDVVIVVKGCIHEATEEILFGEVEDANVDCGDGYFVLSIVVCEYDRIGVFVLEDEEMRNMSEGLIDILELVLAFVLPDGVDGIVIDVIETVDSGLVGDTFNLMDELETKRVEIFGLVNLYELGTVVY